MPRSLCFLLLLALLAAGSGLAFTAAAAQAAGPPVPLLAAKDAGATVAGAAATADEDAAAETGVRIGKVLKSWGTALVLGVAGLMGLSALVRRSVGEGVTLLVIVLIVGGFIFAPDSVKGFIESLWRPLSNA